MSSKIEFSKELQEIYNKSKEIITSHLERLDRVSNDIKALENVLKSAALPFTFCYHIKYDYPVYANIKRHYDLLWENKRLVYREWQVLEDFPETVLEAPLIETEQNIRISVNNELPHFFEQVISSLDFRPDDSYIEVFSPNHPSLCEDIPF